MRKKIFLKIKKPKISSIIHWGIIILSLAIGAYSISRNGYNNSYYAAAVKSMLQSWHNFFFVSYDPGGFITVDKPPLALWFQTASAKIFGYHGWSLLLPDLIAQVLSVEILYRLVKKTAGEKAGLISAALLALTPISVVLSATNQTDPILILFFMLSAWALFKNIESKKIRYLFLSAIFLGLAFNTKMFAAFFIAPAWFVTYLLANKDVWKKKLRDIILAGLIFLTVAFFWVLIVDAVPTSERPYVGSTQNNSELTLATGYNGLQRIFGQKFGFMIGLNGSSSSSSNYGGGQNNFQRSENMQPPTMAAGGGNDISSGMPSGMNGGIPIGGQGGGGPGGMGGGNGGPGGGGNGSFGGKASALRLLGSSLGGNIGWYLGLALIGLIAIFLREKIRLPLSKYQTAGMFWGLWAIATGIIFSVAQFMHPYYSVAMGPAVAALCGIGLSLMIEYYQGKGWKRWLLPAAWLAAAACQWKILSNFSSYNNLKIIITVIFCLISLTLIVGIFKDILRVRKYVVFLAGIALAALIAFPVVWIQYTLTHQTDNTLPSAGPGSSGDGGRGGLWGNNGGGNFGGGKEFSLPSGSGRQEDNSARGDIGGRAVDNNIQAGGFGQGGSEVASQGNGGPMGNGGGQGGGLFGSSNTDSSLVKFLLANQGNAKFIVATESSHSADGLIINTGKPVMSWGGFSGSDPAITLNKFKEDVKEGIVRYVLISYGNGGRSSGKDSESSISGWVSSACMAVSGQSSLYDCQKAEFGNN
jgi:4-amino-4-deoxy-L-arabinose transferase-like glycosyltransferase